MRRVFRNPAATASLMLLTACSTRLPPRSPVEGVEHRGSAVIVYGAGLQGRGNLVEVLSSRVSSMRVQRRPGPACPVVLLRGSRTILSDPNPLVYVDGARMTDTCILTQLPVVDVARVEVYPNGITQRSDYPAHSTGLILIFLTGSERR